MIVPWSEEELKRVERLWRDGMSAGEIRKGLSGRSRNAVMGMVYRRGWTRSDDAVQATRCVRSTSMVRAVRPSRGPRITGPRIYNPLGVKVTGDTSKPRKPNAETLKSYTGLVAASKPKPWIERGTDECVWIVELAGADSKACCAPVCKRGTRFGWCEDHATVGLGRSTDPRTYAASSPYAKWLAEAA